MLTIFPGTGNFLFLQKIMFLQADFSLAFAGDFQRSLNDCKSPLISRTLPSIQANLNETVIWMVSILPLISNSSSLLPKLLEIVPSSTTICTIVTLIFQRYFSLLSNPSICLDFHFLFVFRWNRKINWMTMSLFLVN